MCVSIDHSFGINGTENEDKRNNEQRDGKLFFLKNIIYTVALIVLILFFVAGLFFHRGMYWFIHHFIELITIFLNFLNLVMTTGHSAQPTPIEWPTMNNSDHQNNPVFVIEIDSSNENRFSLSDGLPNYESLMNEEENDSISLPDYETALQLPSPLQSRSLIYKY